MKRFNFSMIAMACMFIAAMMLTPSAKAQFSLGIKVAGNCTNYMEDVSDMNAGIDAGIFFRLGDAFYLQPEVNYSFRSTKLNGRDMLDEFRENSKYKQHFLDIPILLGYNFVNNDNFKFHLIAGPRFGMRVGSNIDEVEWMMEEDGKLQWGGQFGLGIDFWRFTLDARYDISGSKFRELGKDPEFWKQNMIVLSLGFKFIK